MKVKKEIVPSVAEDDDIKIKLKPFLDIRPGVYLVVLYSFAVLVVLFFLLVLPGLKNPGSVIVVNTQPAGAGIRINDVYMGLSGGRIFMPKGQTVIEAVMPGFEKASITQDIPGQIFGSLFFPRIIKIDIELNAPDPVNAFSIYASDYAAWSFGGEPTEAWQVPLSLSEGAYRTGAYVNKEMHDILLASSRYAVTNAALRDLIRAKALLDSHGGAPSPVTLAGSLSGILAFLSHNTPGSAAWLSNTLPSEAARIILDSDWYKNEPAAQVQPPDGRSVRRFSLYGLDFASPADGDSRGSFPADYMISETPVPASLFETFLIENPQWGEHITSYLNEELANLPYEITGEYITGITWFAAEAFCAWLSARLPASMADMEVTLPTEAQWRYAALSITGMNNPLSRFGGFEWCKDQYAPLSFIDAQAVLDSPERSLGGRPMSLRTTPPSGALSHGYSLPPELSSPFVTFRPAVVPKSNRE